MQFAAPRLAAQTIPRIRLLDRLDAAGSLVILRAPAGAGKSTLLAQWAERAGEPTFWCRPDVLEGPEGYWHRLAGRLVAAGLAPPGSAQLPDLGAGQLLAAIPQRLTLVLDDVHEWPVTLRKELGAALRQAVNVRVVVSGRDCTPFDTAGAVTRRPPTVIDGRDLEFTEAECVELCHQRGTFQRDDVVRALRGRLGGSPGTMSAAIAQLSELPPRISTAVATERASEAARLTVEDLAAEADPDVERFLRDTAEADELDLELAAELSAPLDAKTLLARCIELGIGTWVGPLAGVTFVFSSDHRLAWRARARAVDPQRATDCAARIARWSVRSGKPWTALRIAVERNDLRAAESVMRDDLYYFLAHRPEDLRALLEPVSIVQLQRFPFLAMGLAVVYNAEQAHKLRAMELFVAAAMASRAQLPRARDVDRVMLLTVDGVVRRVQGKAQLAAEAAENALAALEGLSPAQRDRQRHQLGTLYTQNGISLLYAGRAEDALEAFATAFDRADQDPLAAFHGGSLTAGTLALAGELGAAARLVADLDSRPWPSVGQDYTGTFLGLARILLALEVDDLAQARAVATELDSEIPTSEHAALIIAAQALVDLHEGWPEAGLARLPEGRRRRRGRAAGPLVDDVLLTTEVALHLAAGTPHRARSVLRRSRASTTIGQLAGAQVALVLGEARRALELVGAAERAGVTTPRLRAELAALRAAAGLRLLPDGTAGVDELLALLHAHELRSPLATLPQEDLDRIALVAGDRLPAAVPGRLVSLVRRVEVVRLTPKEQAVLEMLAETGSAAEIAQRTFTAVSTVKSQQASLYRKLGVNSREAALVRARELALLGEGQDGGNGAIGL